MSICVKTTVLMVVPSLKTIRSFIKTLVLSNSALTAKVEAPLSSAMLTNPSLLVSVVIVTVGAALALDVVVSILTESVPCGVWLPAASMTVAVTLRVKPSAGLLKVVVIKPLSISACVKTTSVVVEPSLTRTVSPTATLVLSNAACTATVEAPLSSLLLTKPSSLASVVMVTVGALLSLDAVVSILAESVPSGDSFPEASMTDAVTVKVAPSSGLVKVVLAKPLSISACCKTTFLTENPSLTRTVSPTETLVLSNAVATVQLLASLSSALLTKPSLLASVVMVTLGAALPLGAVASTVNRVPGLVVLLPAGSVTLMLGV